MTDRTAKERMARKRQRDRAEKGIVSVLVRVHHTRKAEIREAAAKMQDAAVDEKEIVAKWQAFTDK